MIDREARKTRISLSRRHIVLTLIPCLVLRVVVIAILDAVVIVIAVAMMLTVVVILVARVPVILAIERKDDMPEAIHERIVVLADCVESAKKIIAQITADSNETSHS